MKAPARQLPLWLCAMCAAALFSSRGSAADVKLTGIMKMASDKKAMLVVKDRHVNLGEGESQGPIEVLRIDEKTKQVTIRTEGRQMDLSFEKDGAPRITPVAQPDNVATAPGIQPQTQPIPQLPPVPQVPQASVEPESEEPAAVEAPSNNNNVIVVGRSRRAARSGTRAQRPNAITPLTQPAIPGIPRGPVEQQPGVNAVQPPAGPLQEQPLPTAPQSSFNAVETQRQIASPQPAPALPVAPRPQLGTVTGSRSSSAR